MLEACIDWEIDADCAFDECHLNMILAKPGQIFTCEECGGEIKSGEFYEYCYATFKDKAQSVFTFHTCWICLAIIRDFGSGSPRLYGDLWNQMQEIYGISFPDHMPEWDDDEEAWWVEQKRKEAGLPALPEISFIHPADGVSEDDEPVNAGKLAETLKIRRCDEHNKD